MQDISNDDLLSVIGGAGSAAVCTPGNPQGKPAQQFLETSHAGPSKSDSIKDATNTMTSRGMSMLNDGRPSMPSEW